MELEQLRIFIAVAENGSFTQSARKLYISHSTTSRAISALEQELGLRLVERDKHVLGLTAAGETLLEEARKICAMADALPDKLRHAEER